VPESNSGWSIQDITFENVNIKIENQTNEDEVAILGNLFFNGETASVWASNGHRLHIGMLRSFHFALFTLCIFIYFLLLLNIHYFKQRRKHIFTR
jgi:hypothetical protein